MPIKKLWDYVIEVKEGFVPRKKEIVIYSLISVLEEYR